MKKEKIFNTVNTTSSLEDKLIQNAHIDKQALFNKYNTSQNGLSTDESILRFETYGKNVITSKQKDSKFRRLLSSIVNPFNLILIAIAIITFLTDVIFVKGNPDYLTVIIIFILVTVSSSISFMQSEKSRNAVEELTKLVTNNSNILRDGKWIEIPIENIVPGDIIKLAAGDMIPADIRFLTTKDTFVAQSALTGESHPVEKFSNISSIDIDIITDLDNIGFMGSNILSGSATALVISTGNHTYFGSMAKTLSGDNATKSFERGVSSISRLLISLTLIMVPMVFLINGIIKQDWLQSLMFAISIAVGLTPEMLPVIMTTTLAKGAVSMSRHKVVVKNLGTIQTFGEMDILCTDKTGTLTEDKIVLEKYMNLHGEDDDRVLRHAFLNSYFQTGLKNLIDLAIINRATKKDLKPLTTRYEKIDEIPFDFSRRRMSVVLIDKDNKRQLITKGAVEEMLEISKFVEINGQVLELTDTYKKFAMATYEKYNKEGLRIIAVAQKNEVPKEHIFSVKDESNMVLIGFIGFLDPPKKSASIAINKLRDHGVRTIVLTGDSEGVTAKVCKEIGISIDHIISGNEVDSLSDQDLKEKLKICNIFAKLSPNQKQRIVKLLQEEGHTVGFLGDGINDAPALHQADVGISVDSAVDIAKETADIVLLEKDLAVLEEGVLEGRKTFGNIMKYIKMATSGNFGNMISVIVASIFLPFLPMLPVQLLAQNLLNDFSQVGMAFDNVDKEYIYKPHKWNSKSVLRFTLVMGPLSSIFDILCFSILWWVIGTNTVQMAPLFQAGWFVFGTVSQILVIYVIRTQKLSIIESRPSKILFISTLFVALIAIIIGFTDIGVAIDIDRLPISFILWLSILSLAYMISAELVKKIYLRRYNEWI